MRVRVDLESDALYFRISEEEIEESEEVSPGVILEKMFILGIRLIAYSTRRGLQRWSTWR